MSQINRFEDIESWTMAKELVKEIYLITNKSSFVKDYGLSSQIQRAAVSIMSNIAEGFERGTNKEFIHFLYIAKGSAGEVRSQLYIALDLEYITKEEFSHL
jgi:four helix bundle protein